MPLSIIAATAMGIVMLRERVRAQVNDALLVTCPSIQRRPCSVWFWYRGCRFIQRRRSFARNADAGIVIPPIGARPCAIEKAVRRAVKYGKLEEEPHLRKRGRRHRLEMG